MPTGPAVMNPLPQMPTGPAVMNPLPRMPAGSAVMNSFPPMPTGPAVMSQWHLPSAGFALTQMSSAFSPMFRPFTGERDPGVTMVNQSAGSR